MVLAQHPDLAALVQARYGQPLSGIPALPHLELLLNHRSVRAYRPDPLPEGTLAALMAAAQSAATSSNLQTWSVIAIRDAQRKSRLAELAGGQAHIRQCPLFLVWLADLARLAQLGETHGLPYAGLDYLELFLTACIDAALAAQNAVIAAEGMGLGTVYIGALRNQPEAVAAELALPRQTFAVFGLCVGYGAQGTAIKPRLPQRAVVHEEQYQLEPQAEAIAEYNQVMRNFYRAQNMKVDGDWTEHSLRRVAGPESLSGRSQLRQALHQLGFKLL
ncbi:MAG: NADPH-dependent oxidoreductase [Cyanobacteriota bacterium]